MGGIMKKEYWKPVVGYEGLYEVSNWGRVKSVNYNHTGKEKILKQNQIKNGYKSVMLYKDGNGKNYLVHRLVAEAFLPNPNDYKEVNHKDENKLNNSVDNLEWCTNEYNHNYGTINERISQSQSKPVLQYDLEGNFIKEWKSVTECCRNGYNQGHVGACCRDERKTHKGFIWEYKNEEDN